MFYRSRKRLSMLIASFFTLLVLANYICVAFNQCEVNRQFSLKSDGLIPLSQYTEYKLLRFEKKITPTSLYRIRSSTVLLFLLSENIIKTKC